MALLIPELAAPSTKRLGRIFVFDLPVSLQLLSHAEDRLLLQLSFHC